MDEEKMKEDEKGRGQKVREIFAAYIKSMLLAFTGGSMTLPLLQQQLSERYQLMTKERVLENFALGQALPGVISLNSGILIGREIAGWPGGLAAVAGCVLPAFFGMLLITFSYTLISGVSFISGVIGGFRAASIAIILQMGVNILKLAKNAFGFVLAGFAFLATFALGWNIVAVVVLCGFAGVAREWLHKRREG